MLNKIDGLIRIIHGQIKRLVLLDYGLSDKNCDRITYFMSEKSGLTEIINHNFTKTRIYSYKSLPIEKYRLFIIML